MPEHARIGVIGGSGLYSLVDLAEPGAPGGETREVATPYGPVLVTLGALAGRRVAFLPRHGAGHSVAPHLIRSRANVWALASLGVRAIVSSSAVGALHPDYPPGTLVLTDQFIDRTWGRADTFFDRGSVQHLASADPFDPELHELARTALERAGERFAARGTVVVVQGPRFSTRAESLGYRAMGAHTINMTMCPEVSLAAELNIGTVNLSFVTDTDAGLADRSDADDAADHRLVLRRLAEAQPRILAAIAAIVRALPEEPGPLGNIPAEAVAEVLSRPTADS